MRCNCGLSGANDLYCRCARDDGKRFVVRADEKLTAFLELDIGDCVPGFAAAKRIIQGVIFSAVGAANVVLDYVIRRFNLPSARLNKPQGLDLR